MSDAGTLAQWLQRRWYGRRAHPVLRPLGALYGAGMALRRVACRLGLLRVEHLPVPVIVVGNLTVGGTGKTPLAAALVAALGRAGYRPGIASRGHGGTEHGPWLLSAQDSPDRVGDEPLLLAAITGAPVCIARRRAAAARRLVEAGCDVVVCDDGLQHLALGRDREIVVIDSSRGLGNGRCLPAGPLREPASRLAGVDLVVFNGTPASPLRQRVDDLAPGVPQYVMQLRGGQAVPLVGTAGPRPLSDWRGQRVHAVAGIGNPGRFFESLRAEGLSLHEHPFPDHHRYIPGDIDFADGLPVLMTSKDAVKCRGFAGPRHHEVPVTAVFDAADEIRLQHWLAAALGTSPRSASH